jgi:hypothetical protein
VCIRVGPIRAESTEPRVESSVKAASTVKYQYLIQRSYRIRTRMSAYSERGESEDEGVGSVHGMQELRDE